MWTLLTDNDVILLEGRIWKNKERVSQSYSLSAKCAGAYFLLKKKEKEQRTLSSKLKNQDFITRPLSSLRRHEAPERVAWKTSREPSAHLVYTPGLRMMLLSCPPKPLLHSISPLNEIGRIQPRTSPFIRWKFGDEPNKWKQVLQFLEHCFLMWCIPSRPNCHFESFALLNMFKKSLFKTLNSANTSHVDFVLVYFFDL